jgi:putative chitinase
MNIGKLPVPTAVLTKIPKAVEAGIDTPRRLAHFLSQCHHESAGFLATVENLNYSETGLLKVFPKYFTPELAKEYARKPEKIANRVYANRMGNGNEASGDGFRYIGRGYIQLTGKENYEKFKRSYPYEKESDVSSKLAMESAIWFWMTRGLNRIADNGTVADVTRRVNGGTHGLKEREQLFAQYLQALS